MISTVLAQVVGAIILCPFIFMMAPVMIYRRSGKSFITVLGLAADITTPFLFLTIYIISRTIFGRGVGFYIAITAILITIVYAIIEKRQVKDFQIKKFFRNVWRFLFLVLICAYILLLLVGVGFKIWEYLK